MAKKAVSKQGSPTQPSPTFTGLAGKRRLVEALRSQPLVAHDAGIARALQKCGQLHEYERGDVLITQGASDNDIVFLLHGEASIVVNGRAVAKRYAGNHVGEMALVDPIATRSANVEALTKTVVLRVAEHKFSRIANESPELWRRIAVEVANRLRERNRFLPQPHVERGFFIGSSTEGQAIVDAIHTNLNGKPVVSRPWTDGVFEASSTTIESLIALTREADFAALVLTADDVTVSRGKKKPSARDNVVFELGLLMGALGRERVFILKPKNVDIRIPTDLLGVTWINYQKGGPGTLRKKLKSVCNTMLKQMDKHGPR